MIKRSSRRYRSVRSSARNRPSARPVITTRMAISIVTSMPFAIAGQVEARIAGLKNVSRKCSTASASTNDFGHERARALVGRGGENPLGRSLFQDRAVVHEYDAIGSFAGEPHLMADNEHRHPAFAQVPHHCQYASDELGIQCRGRFVEQNHFWLERQ